MMRSISVLAFLILAGCSDHRTADRPADPPVMTSSQTWRPLGEWTGEQDSVTDPVSFDGGTVRIRWTARPLDQTSAFSLYLRDGGSKRKLADLVVREFQTQQHELDLPAGQYRLEAGAFKCAWTAEIEQLK